VDGEVVEGRAAVDESMVTGESMPVTKEQGSRIVGGTMNQTGSFLMRADKVGKDTVLARIVQMVAEAQRSRAPIQRLADQVSGWFVPAVILVAALAFIAWSIFGPEPRMAFGLVAAVSVVIIACPCALGLATPMFPSRSFFMTGAISSSVSTRSPITIAFWPIGSKTTQEPSAKVGFSATPSRLTCKSVARDTDTIDAARHFRPRFTKRLGGRSPLGLKRGRSGMGECRCERRDGKNTGHS
jgi:hypothetical protein